MYFISQLFVIIATISLGATYFFKDKVRILVFCIIYNIFYGIHYLLLSASTGFMMNLVSLIRNVIFFSNSKKEKQNSVVYLIILSVISMIFCIITYKDAYSIVSMIASILSIYSVWQDNTLIYKILALPVSICFLVYAIHINSLFAIITEIVLLITQTSALIKIYKEKYINIDSI